MSFYKTPFKMSCARRGGAPIVRCGSVGDQKTVNQREGIAVTITTRAPPPGGHVRTYRVSPRSSRFERVSDTDTHTCSALLVVGCARTLEGYVYVSKCYNWRTEVVAEDNINYRVIIVVSFLSRRRLCALRLCDRPCGDPNERVWNQFCLYIIKLSD